MEQHKVIVGARKLRVVYNAIHARSGSRVSLVVSIYFIHNSDLDVNADGETIKCRTVVGRKRNSYSSAVLPSYKFMCQGDDKSSE
jgi:hypothetical protein